MNALWYAIVSMMLSVYVVLDGFDFGAGILHLFVARKDEERRQVLKAIGPFWNGNEVWLIASGGLLVFAFPRVYAAGFSGFYLPLMMVLWLLILRGISIEFRSKEENPLWRTFWDSTFFASSLLMGVILGAALGNVVRGVPINSDGYFHGSLFTNFAPGTKPGVLDWYTVSVGIFATLVLAGHGALYLTWKTAGIVHDRSLFVSKGLWFAILFFGVLITYLTTLVRPELYGSLLSRPWTWLFAVVIAGSLVVIAWAMKRKRELTAFFASSCFILALLAATAAGMYPNMLISTVNSAYNLTAVNSSVGIKTLRIGLMWWIPAMVLAISYFVRLFGAFAERIPLSLQDDGH